MPQLDHLHRRRAGILQHRGYPIEQLCEHSSYLEVAYLLIHGELPTQSQLDEWIYEITIHTFVHENVKDFMQGFRYDANPMGMLVASVGALSTFYPDANQIHDEQIRAIQIIRLLAKMPTLAAFAFRHNMGQPYVYPDNDLAYAGNFLGMMYKMTELKYQPDPRLERALDVLFILHADHEQNASTSAVRSVGLDPGRPLLGGRRRAWRRCTGRCTAAPTSRRCGCCAGSSACENIPDFLEGVKAGNERLMGFGHRVYKNYDPRARIIRKHLDASSRCAARARCWTIATELEKQRARRRVLHLAQALPQRGLLLGPDLRGARPAGGDVPRDVRDRAHQRLDRPVARDGAGPRAEDRPPPPDLHGRARPRLRADRSARLSSPHARLQSSLALKGDAEALEH